MATTAEPALPAVVTVRIEVPAGGHIKRDAAGGIDLISPVPSPFNYGSVPGTRAPDGEPDDAIVLGPPLPRGHVTSWVVHGVVRFVDAGLPDPKLICGPAPPTADDLRRLHTFFVRYAALKTAWGALRGLPPSTHDGYEAR